jgi:tetratricopeptide (TPR) repeat protein
MICRRDAWFHGVIPVALVLALVLSAAASASPAGGPLAEAARALARGDGIAAEVAARRALDAGAVRSEVAAFLGEADLLQGDLSAARGWLGTGEFSPATEERGYHALGRLELEEGDLAAAAQAFDRALETGRGSARLWVDIGRLRYRAGQHHLAVDAAARAIAIDPADPRALEFQAQLTRDSKGVVAALPWFERALEKAPDDLGLLGEYAATLAEAGRHKDMLRVARRMVELDPRHPRGYFLQAVLAARAGLSDLARRLMSRTNGAYDEVPAGQLLAGVLELRTGNAALAVERFDELARRQPENAAVQLLLGRALLADGEANEVVARYAAAANRPEASPYLLALVGRAHEQLGARAEAARYLDRAARAGGSAIAVLPAGAEDALPGDAGADVARVRQMLAQGRGGEAGAIAAELVDRFPDSIDVEILSGDAALLTGSASGALAAYGRAAAVRRDFALTERMVAAHRMLGHEQEAADVLAAYLAQNPRSAPASTLLGRLLARRGDWPRASLLFAHARSLGAGDARLLADLAEAELALGEPAAARETASRAYALQRANGRVAATLARVMQDGEGRGREAQVLLAKAHKLSEPAALEQR